MASAVEEPFLERYSGAARDVYRRVLLEQARIDPRIYCLDSDMGGLEENFGAELPQRYVNVGIAEANLMTIAAGLAASGKIPFVNTMAGFASARALEQVKLDIAYHRLPVKIVATHAGVAAGHLGPTHQALEDLAILRALPYLTIIVPADAAETALAVEAALHLPGPVYLRLGRKATAPIYRAPYAFEPGFAVELRGGDDVTLVAAGPSPLLAALAAHDQLAAVGISARVLNLHTIKPLDTAALVAAARETAGIVTVEEHSILGGLGGAVAETLAEHWPAPVFRIGFPDTFCEVVGEPDHLLATYGITAERIAQAATRLVRSRASSVLI